MDVSASSAIAALAQQQSKADQAGAALADNFDTFLTLLTTQLKNQDPLDPLKSNEFTQQLVQFSSVEQAIATNKNLESLLSLIANTTAQDTVSLIGKEIEAYGAAADLKDGNVEWTYNLADNAADTTMIVTDSVGRTVYSETVNGRRGANTFAWNGQTSAGTPAPDGTYLLKVVANTADGEPVAASTFTKGLVTSVDFSSGQAVLKIGSRSVSLSDVVRVSAPTTPAI